MHVFKLVHYLRSSSSLVETAVCILMGHWIQTNDSVVKSWTKTQTSGSLWSMSKYFWLEVFAECFCLFLFSFWILMFACHSKNELLEKWTSTVLYYILKIIKHTLYYFMYNILFYIHSFMLHAVCGMHVIFTIFLSVILCIAETNSSFCCSSDISEERRTGKHLKSSQRPKQQTIAYMNRADIIKGSSYNRSNNSVLIKFCSSSYSL